MSTNQHSINPLTVLKLRIHLFKYEIITWKELADLAGLRLTQYMISQPGFPEQDLSEKDGEHWKCRNLAKWMRDHPKLKDLYVQGKMIKNPSGRTFEINRGYRPGRI